MKKTIKGIRSLSAYTMAKNCTDVSDCVAGINELTKFIEIYHSENLYVPATVYKRFAALWYKREKLAK